MMVAVHPLVAWQGFTEPAQEAVAVTGVSCTFIYFPVYSALLEPGLCHSSPVSCVVLAKDSPCPGFTCFPCNMGIKEYFMGIL